MNEFGTEMRRLREARCLSQPALARLLYSTQSTISRLETGRLVGTVELARRVDQLLHADGKLAALWQPTASPTTRVSLALTGGEWMGEHADELAKVLTGEHDIDEGNALRLAHEWLITDPPQVVEVQHGRVIGERLVGEVEARVAKLRRMDDYVGGGDLGPVVTAELVATVELLRDSSYTEALGRRLLTAVAELAQLAGWVHSDAGKHETAERLYVAGVTAAHAAGNKALGANLLSFLSYQVANVGEPKDAVLMARTAHAGAKGHATPKTRALLGERVAWALARAGESADCERALGEVDDLYTEGSDDPEWVYWLNRDEIAVMAGRCYTELRRPLRAEPLLREALERYDASRARERSLYLTWLADTYLHAGEIDAAAATALEALDLSRRVNSARDRARVEAVRKRLWPHRALPAVRAFEDRWRTAAS